MHAYMHAHRRNAHTIITPQYNSVPPPIPLYVMLCYLAQQKTGQSVCDIKAWLHFCAPHMDLKASLLQHLNSLQFTELTKTCLRVTFKGHQGVVHHCIYSISLHSCDLWCTIQSQRAWQSSALQAGLSVERDLECETVTVSPTSCSSCFFYCSDPHLLFKLRYCVYPSQKEIYDWN